LSWVAAHVLKWQHWLRFGTGDTDRMRAGAAELVSFALEPSRQPNNPD
jgi:hypothetical protein